MMGKEGQCPQPRTSLHGRSLWPRTVLFGKFSRLATANNRRRLDILPLRDTSKFLGRMPGRLFRRFCAAWHLDEPS